MCVQECEDSYYTEEVEYACVSVNGESPNERGKLIKHLQYQCVYVYEYSCKRVSDGLTKREQKILKAVNKKCHKKPKSFTPRSQGRDQSNHGDVASKDESTNSPSSTRCS
jgi:hypothetical protein